MSAAVYRTSVITPLAGHTLEPVLRLWRSGDALGAGAESKLAHAYHQNPAGPGRLILLHAPQTESHPVGVLALHQRRLWRGAQCQDVALLADFVVDPHERTVGPALTLMRAAIAEAALRGWPVYGLPNALSLAVTRRVGLRKAADMQRFGKLLRGSFWLARSGPGWAAAAAGAPLDLALTGWDAWRTPRQRGKWREATFDDGGLETIWAGRPRDQWLADRSPGLLAWRFGHARGARSGPWRLALRTAEGGAPSGYVIWRARHQDSLVEVGDCFCLDMEAQLAAHLLEFAGYARSHLGAGALSLECMGSPRLMAALSRVGWAAKGAPASLVAVSPASAQTAAALDGFVVPGFGTTLDRDPDA